MFKKIRHVVERFPEKEERIREFWETNATFESLTHQHSEISERLQYHVDQGGEPGREAKELRRRRAALEEEMLAIMDQSSRV